MIRNLLDSLYRRHPFDYLIAWRNPDVMLKDGSLLADKRVLSDGQRRVTALVAPAKKSAPPRKSLNVTLSRFRRFQGPIRGRATRPRFRRTPDNSL